MLLLCLAGTLPDWGTNGSMPELQYLSAAYNNLHGQVPQEWGIDG